MADKKEVDELSGVETTGHEWDGVKELNNPLPRWWLWTFYATVIWALLYTIAFPAWPLISSATGGVLGYNSRLAVHESIAEHREARKAFVERINQMDLEEIAADQELMQFAQAGGAASFRTYCSQCHGAGAQGFVGYPNLNDDAWIWGGTLEDIYLTIAHGIRSEEDPDTRFAEMPAFGADELLSDEEIAQVVEYVLRISGQAHDGDGRAGRGRLRGQLRRLPRRGGRGRPGAGRAQHQRRDLALRRRPRDADRDRPLLPRRHDAGLAGPAERRADQAGDALRPLARRRPVGRGAR